MSGHADEAGQALGPRLDRSFQGPAVSHRDLPFSGVGQRMELKQIDRIHPKPVQGASDLVACRRTGALAGLRGEEEVGAVRAHPRPDPEFRVAVAGRGVDMIHAVLEQKIQGAVRFALTHVLERRCSEYRRHAHVTGTAESSFLDYSIAPVRP